MLLATDSAASTSWLSRFVERVRVFEADETGVLHADRLPDGRTTLIVRTMADGRRGDLTVSGPRTQALFKRAPGVARAIIVQFKPGWSAPLLGVTANLVTDQFVKLADIWGRAGDELCAELVATPGVAAVVQRLARAIFFRAHDAGEPASARLARRAVRLLEADEARVEDVATHLGVTARHLRRAFTEHVGVAPKLFARGVRLQRALRLTASSQSWSRIALDAGYYDQAHLIADFKELVGLTPRAFLNRKSEWAPSA